jgi:hypothetical protein
MKNIWIKFLIPIILPIVICIIFYLMVLGVISETNCIFDMFIVSIISIIANALLLIKRSIKFMEEMKNDKRNDDDK